MKACQKFILNMLMNMLMNEGPKKISTTICRRTTCLYGIKTTLAKFTHRCKSTAEVT
jgi:hypothetical protein